MKTKFLIICIASILLCIPRVVSAQKNQLPPFSARVSVSVSADENIKGLIESYIGRELRSLGDVVVTDEKPEWIINIVALELENRAGTKTGLALSIVILEPFNRILVQGMLQRKYKEPALLLMKNLVEYNGHWLRVGSNDDLRQICSSIVADFDTQYLKARRELYQKILDYQKSNRKSEEKK